MVNFKTILYRAVYPLFALAMYVRLDLAIFMNLYLIALGLIGLSSLLAIITVESEIPGVTEPVENLLRSAQDIDNLVPTERVALIIFEILFAIAAFIVGFPWITGLLIVVAFLKRLMYSIV